MSQRESGISQEIMKTLRKNGVFCFKVHGSALMMAGLPDIIACVDGMFVAFETKVPEKRNNTSAIQKRIHELIAAAGGWVGVVCGPAEAMAAVDGIREGLKVATKSLVRKGYQAGYKKAIDRVATGEN